MSLRELRAYTGRTQVEAAAENEMTQSELSRLERREDFLLSTLRRYVDSLGGTLEVRVMLGSSEIRLSDGERGATGWEMKAIRQAVEVLASIEAAGRPAWAGAAPLGRPPRGQALTRRLRLRPGSVGRALPLVP